jgi:hypothetical protein
MTNPDEMALDLDRRFLEWRKESDSDPEVWSRFRLNDGTLAWSDLLKRRRVVMLAEGGSGKSTEFKRQVRLQIEGGRDAWYLTVQDVAEEGIEGSLSPTDRQRFQDWTSILTERSNRPEWHVASRQSAAGPRYIRSLTGYSRGITLSTIDRSS